MKRELLYTLALLFTSIQAYAQIYTYDANNKLTKVEYGNGVTISYEYDVLGNRTSRKVTGSIAETYTIKVSAVPSNYGTVSGGGTFGIGTNVEINACPYAGFEFQEWNDGSTDNPRTLTVTKDQSFTAHFKMSETNNNYDANGDGVINSYDLDAIIDAYLEGAPATGATDLDGDGAVTIADASILIAQLNDTHTGTYNGHDYVDLGLPSGTLWATCNVGASYPEENGCFYAWGEVTGSCEGKDRYSWSTYKYDNGMLGDELTKYNFDPDIGYNGFTDNLGTLDPTDDAATVNWGGNWRMPTRRELSELYNKKYTEWTFTTMNGVKGFIVTSIVKGYTGNSIFLPAEGGLYDGKTIELEGELSYYWTSTLTSNYQYCASCFDLRANDGKHGTDSRDRCYGMSIRPVLSADGIPAEPNLRLFAYDYDLDGTRYALYRQSDKNDVRYNADNTPYYRTKFTLDVTKNGSTETYTIDDNIYFTEEGDAQIPCMAIDLTSNKMFIFVNSSNGYSYSLDGYCFVSSLNNINFQKETVFTEANFGWWPYFTYDNGTLQLQHFSFAGYYAMTSTRSSNGVWTTDWGYDIYPDEFRALSEQAGKVLVIRGGSQDCPIAEAIDLGLPSGTRWASWNVGASAPEEYGGYYAWGETEEKDYYDWSNYKYFDDDGNVQIGDDIAGTEYDVAHVKWGGSWIMPTTDQIKELIVNCTRKWTTQNGVSGALVTGPNGNSIFLPAAGELRNDGLRYEGKAGFYWSSSLYTESYVHNLYFDSGSGWSWSSGPCHFGLPVRPVISPEKPQGAFSCPDDHHPHMIDLGLSSGTKWSCCNIDATNPVEKGNYYAWGETETKDRFSWGNYIHCDGSKETCHDIGGDISGTEYDVAYVKWGSDWQMPTYDQFSELLSSCNFEETSLNGIKGVKIVGPNGNCIFMPATDNYAFDGSYWSATNNNWQNTNSYFMALWGMSGDFDPHMVGYSRYEGCCVRPVAAPQKQCPEAEAIDLGLPSGTLWASWNVGASAPEEYGGYYAWGETEEKDYYDESTYKYYNSETEECIHIGDDIAGTEYDVAHVKWGGSWRMPTRLQQDELRAYCSNEWTQQNGVNGIRVTGPNGNSIFLPAAGSRWGGRLNYEGERGIYWSSSLYSSNYGCYQYFNSNYWDYGSYVCCTGLSVRAVINAEKAQRDCPIAEAIDLGLPSGTKWASWNIGASKPEEYGGYYAWGETEETHYYDWSTYTHCDGSSSTCHHIGDDIAGTEYDVAHVKWGGSWRMPTNEQQDELRENCTREWTQQNGVNGIRVTGPNGNSIFLPAAGYRSDVYLRYEGSYGYFWSSSRNSIGSGEIFACRLRFNSSYWSWSSDDTRCYGLSVRAVCP